MADIATLGLKIDASGAVKAIDDTGKSLLDLGKKAAGVAKVAGAALAGAFAGGAALVVKNTIEAEQAFAQLEARVKSTGGVAGFTAGELANIASELQSVSTFGDEAIQSMQSVLLTFTNVRGDNFKAANAAILDMATALGTDLQSAAMQVGKALNDPIRGVSALSRAGVQLSEDQKALVEQLQTTGDIAGAQAIILKELEKQFGGAAAAARNTLGGALQALKNSFGDLFEVPELVAPITAELNKLVDFLSAPSTLDAVKRFIKDAIAGFLVFGSAIADVVGVVATSLGQIAGLFGKLSGPNSPLNKFARGAEAVANGAALASIKLEGMAVSVATAEKKTDSATGKVRAFTQANTEAAAAVGAVEVKVREAGNAYTEYFKWVGDVERAIRKSMQPLSELPTMLEAVQVAALPEERLAIGWEAFFADLYNSFTQLGDWAKEAAQSVTNALLGTFSNIAARGKATIGDLFATIAQLAPAGGPLGAVAAAGGIVADLIGGARQRAREAQRALDNAVGGFTRSLDGFVASFTDAGGAFAREVARIQAEVAKLNEAAAAMLTITAQRALSRSGGDVDKAIANLNTRIAAGATGLTTARDQLIEFRDAVKATGEAAAKAKAEAKANLAIRRAEFAEDTRVRTLRAAGRNDEADMLAMSIRFERELAQARREGYDIGLLLQAQEEERAAFQRAIADRETQDAIAFARTIGGLDAEIARASGNEAEARRIEREMTLLDITDELIRAKYEELWAIQDATRAQQEAAEAAELLYNQQLRMEDLEVRRLIATGDAIAAEALRFELQQQRELRQAEKDLALGLITEEIYEKLKEILDLEAVSFADAQAAKNAPVEVPGLAPSRSRDGGTANIFSTAAVGDIDRVVGELTTIRVRAGQLVDLMTRLVRGGGIMGVVNAGLQSSADGQRLGGGNILVT
jgi:hypothetical protein